MRGFGMNKNNPPNTFANRFWHSDTCLDVEMNKSKYFMEYIPKYYAESRKTPEDILSVFIFPIFLIYFIQ